MVPFENVSSFDGNALERHQRGCYGERSRNHLEGLGDVVDYSVGAGIDGCALAGSRHQSRCLGVDGRCDDDDSGGPRDLFLFCGQGRRVKKYVREVRCVHNWRRSWEGERMEG